MTRILLALMVVVWSIGNAIDINARWYWYGLAYPSLIALVAAFSTFAVVRGGEIRMRRRQNQNQ